MTNKRYNLTDYTWHKIATEDNVWIKWRFEILKKSMTKIGILLNNHSHCLDVGCGSNNFSFYLEKISNFKIDQADVDKNFIKKKKGRGNFFHYDINKRKAKFKNKYDIIFLLDVLEHIDNEDEFLKSCYFHLKKDGYLILNVPSVPELFSKYDTVVGHFRRYKKQELKKLLLKNKYKVHLIKYWGFLLVPILFLRKILINVSNDNKKDIIKKGMDTKSKFVWFILSIIKYLELNIIKFNILGSSLISIVKK